VSFAAFDFSPDGVIAFLAQAWVLGLIAGGIGAAVFNAVRRGGG
jgi:hypothetical protein